MENQLHARDKVGVQDFVLLEDFKNPVAFVDNLRKRYQADLIYVSEYIEYCTVVQFVWEVNFTRLFSKY